MLFGGTTPTGYRSSRFLVSWFYFNDDAKKAVDIKTNPVSQRLHKDDKFYFTLTWRWMWRSQVENFLTCFTIWSGSNLICDEVESRQSSLDDSLKPFEMNLQILVLGPFICYVVLYLYPDSCYLKRGTRFESVIFTTCWLRRLCKSDSLNVMQCVQ